jgi:hypothetical protein
MPMGSGQWKIMELRYFSAIVAEGVTGMPQHLIQCLADRCGLISRNGNLNGLKQQIVLRGVRR